MTRVAMWFSAKITSSCHTCWLSYFTSVCLWCGRTVGGGRCTVRWLPNFLGWLDLLTHGAPQARASRARELRYYMAKSVFALASVNLRSITYSANQNAIGHFTVHMLQGEPKMPLVNLRSISYSADQNFKSKCSFCSTNFDYLQKKV